MQGALLAMQQDRSVTKIEQRHFLAAAAGLHRTITAEMLAFYERYREADARGRT